MLTVTCAIEVNVLLGSRYFLGKNDIDYGSLFKRFETIEIHNKLVIKSRYLKVRT